MIEEPLIISENILKDENEQINDAHKQTITKYILQNKELKNKDIKKILSSQG